MSLPADMQRLCNEIKAERAHRYELRERLGAECAQRSAALKQTLAEESQARQSAADASRATRAAQAGAIRSAAAQTCADARALLGRFAAERAGVVSAFLADQRGRRLAAETAAAAERRQTCAHRRRAIHVTMALWQEQRTRATALWRSLRSEEIQPVAAPESLREPVADQPAVALATDQRTLSDTIYMLVNSHPEGIAVVDVERILSLPRVVVGQTLRRLVEAGRVRRDSGLYFTDGASQDQ